MTSETANAAAKASPEGPEEKASPRQRAKRLPAAERKAIILHEAALFFAREGFAASTRDLADQLGVRQALLYKYFPSKEALLEEVFEKVFSVHWAMAWSKVIFDQSQSLEDRLTHCYAAQLETEDGIALRLFLRAALDGLLLPGRRLDLVKEKLVLPVIGELRREANLPGLDAQPLMIGEFELFMVLHSSVIFYTMRTYIYGGPMTEDMRAVVRLYVATFLNGARAGLPSLHGSEAPASLKLPLPQKKAVA